MKPETDTETPRIYLIVALLAPIFFIYFVGSLISTRYYSPEEALLLPLFGIFGFSSGGPLFLIVPVLLLAIVGIVERKTWKVVVSTSALSLLLIALYWIMYGPAFY